MLLTVTKGTGERRKKEKAGLLLGISQKHLPPKFKKKNNSQTNMTVSPSFLHSLKTHETGYKFLPDCFQGAVVMCQGLCELNMSILYDRVYLQGQVTWKSSRVGGGRGGKKEKNPHNVMQDYHNPIKLLPILSKNKPPKISVASDENWFSFSTNS